MSNLSFSNKLAASLAVKHNLGDEKQAEMAYAIEILTLNVANAVLTLTLGWILGVFTGTAACLLTIAAFRHNAGGGHSESPWRCAAITMIVFPLLALAAQQVSTWEPFYLNMLSMASILIGFAFIWIFAPVDNPKAPIESPVWRKKLKMWALLIMAAISTIIIGLKYSNWDKAPEIVMCLVLSLLWVSFNLTPWGRRLWIFIDTMSIR